MTRAKRIHRSARRPAAGAGSSLRRLAIASALTLAACAPRTEVLVSVRSDLGLRLGGVRVEVEAEIGASDGGRLFDDCFCVGGAGCPTLPLTLGLLPGDGADVHPFRVTATAYSDAACAKPLVAQQAVLAFTPGRTLELDLSLLASCEDVACTAEDTCVDGECVSAAHPSLHEYGGDAAPSPTDAGGPSLDGAVDAAGDAAVDAGPAFTPRYELAGAYDPHRRVTVLFGGHDDAPTDYSDTFEWDGAIPRLAATGTPPTATEARLAYDSARGRLVLYGGGGAQSRTQTWERDASGWMPIAAALVPGPRLAHGMVYDEANHVVVLFGGRKDSTAVADNYVWLWDGTRWSEHAPSGTWPSARSDTQMTFDGSCRCVLLYGGLDASQQALADLWSWDGTSWTALGASSGPGPRAGGAMAFDGNRTILFGGVSDPMTTSYYGDTWVWANGWTRLLASGGPQRTQFASAFDAVRLRVVAAGGFYEGNDLDSIVEWDPGSKQWLPAYH